MEFTLEIIIIILIVNHLLYIYNYIYIYICISRASVHYCASYNFNNMIYSYCRVSDKYVCILMIIKVDHSV